jgi:hypothetical protein
MIVSYRTIAYYAFLGLVLMAITLYLISPNYFGRKMKGALVAISGGMVYNAARDASSPKPAAHFVNIDGTVRVRAAGSLQWVRADYNTNLEKGDFVQTLSDGVARLIFADGTNYMLKPDSLIVVEESREDPVTRATRVSVQVTSGAVDLSTGKFEVPGSTSQVSFSDAVASLAEESRAMVRNDPGKNKHEFTVDQGQAEVRRGSANIRLGEYEQVRFDAKAPGLVQQKVIGPPTLMAPINMDLKVTGDPKSTPVDFAWSEVPEAVAYHLQVSSSATFSKFVVDEKFVGQTTTQVSRLDEGTYYWAVSSIDARGFESQPSQANRFSLVQQVENAAKAFLEITRIVQHGKVVEVVGRTEPGSSVIVNNEQVFSIAPDGTFRHFTSPLAESGPTQITITAQNRRGDTNTIRKTVEIE